MPSREPGVALAAGADGSFGMGRSRLAPGGRRGRTQSAAGRADKNGDDDEPEMDRPSPRNGQLDACLELAWSQEKTEELKK
jgi:hypothetical protein